MKLPYLIIGLLVCMGLALAVTEDNGVTTAFPEGNTFSILNADGSLGMTALVGILVGVVCLYIFLNYDHERRLQLIGVIIALYIVANVAGVLSVTSQPIWNDNWVDCTGMNTAQMQSAAISSKTCAYGVDTSALKCNPAQTYYKTASAASKFFSLHQCSTDAECHSWNSQFTNCGLNPGMGFNSCYYLTSSSSLSYVSIGSRRQLVIPCLDSRSAYGACSSNAGCNDIAASRGGSWACSGGQCVQTSNPYKLDGSCSSNSGCTDAAGGYCPSGVQYSICVKSAASPTSCPAGQIKLPVGCNYQCTIAPMTCPSKPCGSGLSCISGLCVKNAVSSTPATGGTGGTGGTSGTGGTGGTGGSSTDCTATCASLGYSSGTLTSNTCHCSGTNTGGTGGTGGTDVTGFTVAADGACSARLDTCDAGKVDAITSNSTHDTWNCLSGNGGAMASCALRKGEQPQNYDFVFIIIALVVVLIVLKMVMGRGGRKPAISGG